MCESKRSMLTVLTDTGKRYPAEPEVHFRIFQIAFKVVIPHELCSKGPHTRKSGEGSNSGATGNSAQICRQQPSWEACADTGPGSYRSVLWQHKNRRELGRTSHLHRRVSYQARLSYEGYNVSR